VLARRDTSAHEPTDIGTKRARDGRKCLQSHNETCASNSQTQDDSPGSYLGYSSIMQLECVWGKPEFADCESRTNLCASQGKATGMSGETSQGYSRPGSGVGSDTEEDMCPTQQG
jgi:hypothetical protein